MNKSSNNRDYIHCNLEKVIKLLRSSWQNAEIEREFVIYGILFNYIWQTLGRPWRYNKGTLNMKNIGNNTDNSVYNVT